MTTRGLKKRDRFWTFLMKYFNIASVISKSAITPSLRGRMASMEAGVLPIISFATLPTARPSRRTWLVPAFTATTDGSLITMPLPLTQTRVFAVPRSIPRSVENFPTTELIQLCAIRKSNIGTPRPIKRQWCDTTPSIGSPRTDALIPTSGFRNLLDPSSLTSLPRYCTADESTSSLRPGF